MHGNKHKFDLVQLKVELMLNAVKNENSRYLERTPTVQVVNEWAGKQQYYKNFFKTPLHVNMCVESMVGPTMRQNDDYGALLITAELMNSVCLKNSVREKGGAYGAGCAVDESGLISLYSYRDP